MTKIVKAAAVQAAPVFLDLQASIDKAIGLIRQASEQGCDLIVFGETWLPGYPFHIWLGTPAWAMQFTQLYFDNSLEVGDASFRRLTAAAREHRIAVAMGYSEREGGSLFLGQCLIDAGGEVVFARRKLKPTHVERTVFGEGYGQDLVVAQTPLGNVGALCCWEHIQPLTKYALYSQNEQIHVSSWPAFSLYRGVAPALGREANMAVTRTYALEGQCFVIAGTSVIDQRTLDILKVGSDAPPLLERGGGSAMIFGPDGSPLADHIPEDEEGLVIADLQLDLIKYAKAVADPAGHYAKPEATRLVLTRTPLRPVVVEWDGAAAAPDQPAEAGERAPA